MCRQHGAEGEILAQQYAGVIVVFAWRYIRIVVVPLPHKSTVPRQSRGLGKVKALARSNPWQSQSLCKVKALAKSKPGLSQNLDIFKVLAKFMPWQSQSLGKVKGHGQH